MNANAIAATKMGGRNVKTVDHMAFIAMFVCASSIGWVEVSNHHILAFAVLIGIAFDECSMLNVHGAHKSLIRFQKLKTFVITRSSRMFMNVVRAPQVTRVERSNAVQQATLYFA